MAIGLSQSDFVAIGVCIAQVVVTIGVAFWSVRRMSPADVSSKGISLPNRKSSLSSFLRESWFFFLFAAYGVYELLLFSQLQGPLTGGQVVNAVFFGAYIVFNILVPFIFWGFIHLAEIVLRIAEIQGRTLEKQIGELSATKDVRTSASTRTRRNQRAG
jgi:hypothetical protein